MAKTWENILSHWGIAPNSGNTWTTTDSAGNTHIIKSDGMGGYDITDATNRTTSTFQLSGLVTYIYHMTQQDTDRLRELRESRDKWIKRQKLKNFQKLPAHLRQAVVDEAYIKEYCESMQSIDTANFDDEQELHDLEAKEALSNPFFAGSSLQQWPPPSSTSGVFLHDLDKTYSNNNYKYADIISEFTADELADAHAQATLEEQIS